MEKSIPVTAKISCKTFNPDKALLMSKKISFGFLLLASLLSIPAMAGSFVISQGSGFGSTTVVAPVGGNPGTTVGQQRANLFNYAASSWTNIAQPSVNITISAAFSALFCDGSGVIFASGGSTASDRNFAGAVDANTWYPQALKNHITATTSAAAISIVVNSNIGRASPPCWDANSDGINDTWYYGYDHNPAAGQIDLLNIVQHEIAHGLGFITLVDLSTGAKFKNTGSAKECTSGCDDIFMKFLRDHSLNKLWPNMSNAERAASAIDTGDLVWSGANVQHVKPVLSGGFKSGTNYPLLYAPATPSSGSSVTHWNTNVTYTGAKGELMEPTPDLPFDMALTVAVMRDIGWNNATYDFDGDGTADHLDDFPHKNAASSDTDGDGKPDSWWGSSGCSGNTCSGLTLDWDDDGDGVPDTVDAGPLDANNKTENNLPLDQTYKGLRYSAQQSH